MQEKQISTKDLDFVFETPLDNQNKCGCYVQSGEVLANNPNKLILVPLRSSEYAVEIVNAVANITLTQVYVNPTETFLEVGYSFPINPNACVYRFTAEFGKTRVLGVVREKEEAKREYKEAVAHGKRAVIGNIDENSKDILHLKVGNIGPREEVRIELVFMQELTLANNTFYQLRLFGTISPRYLNHIPKEVFVQGFRNSMTKTTGAFYWNFSITLRTSRKVVFFDSYSHNITLVSQNEQKNIIQLAMEQAAIPNKDFVFSYTTEDFQLPSYVFGRTDYSSSVMLSFIPKFCSLNLDDAYKAQLSGNIVETDIEQAKGEYVFLLDRSSSMGGKRIEKAKEALILFIKSLPEDTFFNIISFGYESISLFPKSVRYTDFQVEKAVKAIKAMNADMGGTQVYAPLQSLLTSAIIPGYPKQIFLLTDGGVSNTERVLRMVAANTKFTRVHSIGIGNGASEALIMGCAKSGKGYHIFISDEDNPSEKIIQLLTDSLSPVICGMKLGYDSTVITSIIPNPKALPYVLKGEVVNFYITFNGQLAQPTNISFSYEDSANKFPFTSVIQVDPAAMNESFVDRMGHFRCIRLLQEALSNKTEIGELMLAAKVIDLKAEIIKQSVRHQILSQFTAFLCVQKELIDGRYQQISDKGQIRVQVSNPSPYLSQSCLAPNQYRPGGSIARQSSISSTIYDLCSSIPPSQAKNQINSPVSAPQKQISSAVDVNYPQKKNKSQYKGFFQNVKQFLGFSKKKTVTADIQSAPAPQLPPCIPSQRQTMEYKLIEQKSQSLAFKGDNFRTITPSTKAIVNKKAQQYQCQQLKSKKSPISNRAQHLDQCGSQKQQQLINTQTIPAKKDYQIEDIVNMQSYDGSWRDISLIGYLFGKQVQQKVAKELKLIAVITLLVVKWIQKNHPSKQYSLLTKKGVSFIKKETDFEEISESYADIIR